MTLIAALPRAFAAFTRTWALPLTLMLGGPMAAHADDIGRVGRIVEMVGDVSFHDLDRDEWVEAWRNRPVTTGDRIVLARGARLELRVGSATFLLAQGADLEVLALDDDRVRLELHRGALAMRLPSRDMAEQTEVRTRETRLRPQRAGHYRIDREADDDGRTYAAAWRGSLEASGHNHLLLIDAGERHEIWLDGRGVDRRDDRREDRRDDRSDDARSRPARMPDDRLAAWADESFRADERRADAWRSASRDYADLPDVPGIEDLDRYGRWDRHPEFGLVWFPLSVSVGWRPFHEGRWAWVRPWGWTWVDAQPWGFAPSHYGRWVQWHGRWAWWPGRGRTRAVFSPAMVAWVGGPNVSLSFSFGQAPPSSWVPLGPHQHYVPVVVAPPRAYPPRRPPPPKYPQPVPTGPISRPAPGSVTYGPQGVPVGVTPVSGARPVQVGPASPAATAGPAAPAAPAAPVAAPMAPVPMVSTGPAPGAVVVQTPRTVPQPEKADQGEKAEKPANAEKPAKAERNDRGARPEPRPEPRRRDQVQ